MRTHSIIVSPFSGRLTRQQEKDYPAGDPQSTDMRKYLLDKAARVNLNYAKRALYDSITKGEFPFASHLLYPQVLSNGEENERKLGMTIERRWIDAAIEACDARQEKPEVRLIIAVYYDLSLTEGMMETIDYVMEHEHYPHRAVSVKLRSLSIFPEELDV